MEARLKHVQSTLIYRLKLEPEVEGQKMTPVCVSRGGPAAFRGGFRTAPPPPPRTCVYTRMCEISLRLDF